MLFYIVKWVIKKACVDSRFRTRDSNSDSGFKFELKEPLDLPDNIVCYVDDISIPHTWGTIESHNQVYMIFKTGYLIGSGLGGVAYDYGAFVLIVPEGSYTGANLAAGIQDLLNGFVTFAFGFLYHPARGTITIEANSEGMGSHNEFHTPNDFGIMARMGSTGSFHPWEDSQGNVQPVEINNMKSINGVLANSDMITVNLESEYYISYGSGFIDLFNVHNVYLHCPDLDHFDSIGVRGNTLKLNK